MLKAYKYRIYPNKEQKLYFAGTFGCVRFIYNKMLADRIKSYKENKDLDIKKIKYPTPAQYKKEFEWLKEVDSLALANAQMDLNKAYKYRIYPNREQKLYLYAFNTFSPHFIP